MKPLRTSLACLLSVFIAIAEPAYAQTTTDQLIAPELLKTDFSVFRDSLEKLHAGLYTYKSKSQMDQLFNSCSAKLDKPMSLTAFYGVIRYAVSGIEDGHTSAFLPPENNQAIIHRSKFFPLLLYFIGTRAYTTCAAEGLPAGTEITTIEQRPVNALRKELFTYIPSDGSTQTGKYADMNDGDSPFFYLYRLIYGACETFEVGYLDSAGKERTTQLKAKMFQDFTCRPVPVTFKQYLSLTYQPGGIAVMTIKSFFNHKLEVTHEDFARFLQESFTALSDKKIQKLIIDVRDNAGGNDENGARLMGYLTRRPFPYYVSIETTSRKFEVKDHDQLAIQQPREPHFTGPVFVLINGKCFSGTTDFAGIARNLPHVKFIGEETGGGYYGNTSGARTALILPNTKIKVNIPLWKYKAAVKPMKYKDRGIIPDYPLVPTIQDVLQQRDVQMELALKLATYTKAPVY